MRIKQITIQNFRSIKDPITFDLKPIANKKCFVLLGVNESGKSNILDAISILDRSKEFKYQSDCNNDLEGQEVLLSYEIEMTHLDFYKRQFVKHGIDEELVKQITIQRITREIVIDQMERVDYFNVYIKDVPKLFSQYVISQSKILLKTEQNQEKDAEGNIINLLNKNKLEEYIQDNFFNLFNKNIEKVIFWKYEPKYLIDVVDLNTFKDDHNISIPLKNIFQIAGIINIKEKIESVIGSASKIERLEDELGTSISDHINGIWKEHKIKIEIRIDNMQLTFLISEDDNKIPKYEINQRSDGFKHFVSILLNLSAENKTEDLKNKIILIDEPETHLHPSGQKFLRDEILNISGNNIVIFATHSIFMIDKNNLNRHYSVEKKKGITHISQIEKDNPYKEEVLYESLGTSILEQIHSSVLIFEGKTDRDVFELYVRKFKKEIKPVNISLISADGVENIIKYTKFFDQKLIKGYVIVDSDDKGKSEKTKITKDPKYSKNKVFEINDIIKTQKNSTLEDLFDKQLIEETIKDYYGLDVIIDNDTPFIEQIKEFLQRNRIQYRESDKEAIKKDYFHRISQLKKEVLKTQKYFAFVSAFQEKIKS